MLKRKKNIEVGDILWGYFFSKEESMAYRYSVVVTKIGRCFLYDEHGRKYKRLLNWRCIAEMEDDYYCYYLFCTPKVANEKLKRYKFMLEDMAYREFKRLKRKNRFRYRWW